MVLTICGLSSSLDLVLPLSFSAFPPSIHMSEYSEDVKGGTVGDTLEDFSKHREPASNFIRPCSKVDGARAPLLELSDTWYVVELNAQL